MPIARLILDVLLLAAVCGFLFFFGLSTMGLAGADEPRYAQIAREMLARHDWVTPVLNGLPWLEKPILYYWEAMLSYAVFGVSDWAARLPAAIDATTLVGAVYLFARRFCRGAELDAALVTASTAFVIGFSHAASTDMPLTATFAVAMLAWIAWFLGAPAYPPEEAAAIVRGRKLDLLGFYLFLALATLAKGPVAPALAGLIICLFVVFRREWITLWRTFWWPGVLLYAAVALPWYVLVQLRTGTFFRVFILEHNLERYASTVYRHVQPFWYFIPITLLALLPWTVLSVAGFVRGLRSSRGLRTREADLNLLFVLWAAVPVVFFSFSGSKLPGYILPALPPLAMLVALWMRNQNTDSKAPAAGLLYLHALVAGATLSLVLLGPHILLRLPPPREVILVAIGAGFIVSSAIVISIRVSRVLRLRVLTLFPVVIGVAFLLSVAAPVLDHQFSARPVAGELRRVEPARSAVAVYAVDREIEYGLGFYLDQQIARYERGEIPTGRHILVTMPGNSETLEARLPNLRFTMLGKSSSPEVVFYWVTPK